MSTRRSRRKEAKILNTFKSIFLALLQNWSSPKEKKMIKTSLGTVKVVNPVTNGTVRKSGKSLIKL